VIGIVGGIAGFYASIAVVIVRYFAEIDYFTVVIRDMFLMEQDDRKFFARYLNDDDNYDGDEEFSYVPPPKPNCCQRIFDDFCSKGPKINEKRFEQFSKFRAAENEKVKLSLEDGDVDKSDIMTMIFDIFSRRKKFDYQCNERIMLYCGKLGPVLRFCRCRCFNYDNIIRVNKIFEKAKGCLDDECDIIDIFDAVRKSKNFQKNFLTRQQKILLKYDTNNVIKAIPSDKESEDEEVIDIDEIIAKNLNSQNGLVAVCTMAKLMKILKPYTENGVLG